MTARCVRSEAGAAVVVALGLVAALVFVSALGAAAGGVFVAHRRAQAGADLAALAGAANLQQGGDGCAAAGVIAARHRAELVRCRVHGQAVEVTLAVPLPAALGGAGVPARARAGPVPP